MGVRRVTLEELVRAKRPQPVRSVDELMGAAAGVRTTVIAAGEDAADPYPYIRRSRGAADDPHRHSGRDHHRHPARNSPRPPTVQLIDQGIGHRSSTPSCALWIDAGSLAGRNSILLPGDDMIDTGLKSVYVVYVESTFEAGEVGSVEDPQKIASTTKIKGVKGRIQVVMATRASPASR